MAGAALLFGNKGCSLQCEVYIMEDNYEARF